MNGYRHDVLTMLPDLYDRHDEKPPPRYVLLQEVMETLPDFRVVQDVLALAAVPDSAR